MGSGDYLIKLEQRMIGRRWFLFKDVERRACDLARLNCIVKRPLINQSTARAVDYPRAFFHFRERTRIDQSTRVRRQRSMDRQKVCARQHIIKRSRFNFKITRLIRANEGIVGDDFHAERACTTGDNTPNSAESNYPERLVLQ